MGGRWTGVRDLGLRRPRLTPDPPPTRGRERKRPAMLIGVPKEIKDNEYRVGIVPSTVRELTDNGHQVLIETAAGAGAGLPDADYRAAGAEIVADADAVYGRAELGREGEGAARRRAQEAAPRPGAVRLSASRPRPRADRGFAALGRHRDRLRDGDEPAGRAAVIDADVRSRRPHGGACRRAVPGKGEWRPRRAPVRRAGRVAGDRRHSRRRRRRHQCRAGRVRHGRRGRRARPQSGSAAPRSMRSWAAACARCSRPATWSSICAGAPTSSSRRCWCPARPRRSSSPPRR